MSVLVIPMIAWATHGTVISLRSVLLAVRAPFVSALVATLPTAAVHLAFSGSSPLIRLAFSGTVLLVSYLLMLLYVMGQKEFYADLLRELRGRTKAGSPTDNGA
jgi:hypothetical protein